MQEPILMQNQNGPFNEDHFIEKEILKLRDEHNIKTVIELGTFTGRTSEFFAKNFENFYGCEINPEYFAFAKERLRFYGNAFVFNQDSESFLNEILPLEGKGKVLIFQDSHWGDHWPIINELQIIQSKGLKPVIVIHDFKVPGHENDLGYDSYKGVDLGMELVEDALAGVYEGCFQATFNSPEKATGAKRGVAYITPFDEDKVDHHFENEEPATESVP